MDLHLPVDEGYDRWSAFYDGDDIPLNLLEQDVVDGALGELSGLDVVDLACGTGRQSVRLAARGARVTGIDVSRGMLEKARAKSSAVRFLQGSLEEKFPFEPASFDRVVSFLALEHFTDLGHFFSECRRICRPNGFLFFTAMHPAMTLKGVQARYTEDGGRKVYPKSFPYRICDYVNAAVESGLTLERLTEHATSDTHARHSERAAKYEGWPLLLTLRFSPVPRLK